jgi:hypothetical protein
VADPTVVECVNACTVTVVHEFALPLLNLSVADAVTITWQICLVWAAAWCIRQVAQLLNSSGADNDEREY